VSLQRRLNTGYSSGEQIMIVVLGSIVALLSPFTANIYVRSGGSLLFLSNIYHVVYAHSSTTLH
jgi:hypothetical protein